MKMTITDILSIIKPLDVASIFNSLVIAIIGIVFVYKNSKSKAASEMHIVEKNKLYIDYTELYHAMFEAANKNNQKEIKKKQKEMYKLHPKMLVYGSPEVIKKLKAFWAVMLNLKNTTHSKDDIAKVLTSYGDLIKGIREDLMLLNTDLDSDILGRMAGNSMDDEWKK